MDFLSSLTWAAIFIGGTYLFSQDSMHAMLAGSAMMLYAVIGYTIGDHLRRLVPVFGALETLINELKSKIDDMERGQPR